MTMPLDSATAPTSTPSSRFLAAGVSIKSLRRRLKPALPKKREEASYTVAITTTATGVRFAICGAAVGPELVGILRRYIRQRALGPEDRLFPRLTDRTAEVLRADLEAAGIPPVDDKGRVVDLHSLRFTFNSVMHRDGIELSTRQKLMHHGSPELTANTYCSIPQAEFIKAIAAMPPAPPVDRLPASVDSPLLGGLDAGTLSLSSGFLLHFGHGEEHAGDHLAHRAVEVDLLGDGDDTQPSVTPIAKCVDPVAKRSGESVELPADDRLNLTLEDGFLEFPKCLAFQVVAGFLIDKPFDVIDPVALEPTLDLAPLPGCILSRGNDPNVGRCGWHGLVPVLLRPC